MEFEIAELAPNRYFLQHVDCPEGNGRAFYCARLRSAVCFGCPAECNSKRLLILISLLDIKYHRVLLWEQRKTVSHWMAL